MRGNLRKFSMQGFRCVECNEIMRRPPLKGVCPICQGKIIFTKRNFQIQSEKHFCNSWQEI
jgi:DNA polymerase II large subunit